MASEAALRQAREFLDRADAATDDPRRTRVDLLQVANYIAREARQDGELRDVVSYVSDFLAGQTITGEDLDRAAENGWPIIESVPGPISYFYAGLRLGGHAALRSGSLIDNFEARVGDVAGLSASVRQTIEGLDTEWASALTVVAAERAAQPGDFRNRLTAAAKDVQQLVTSDELPTWDDFAEGPAESAWPPLRLGVYPALGGRFRNDPDKDWENQGIGGGGFGGMAACIGGFGLVTGDVGKMLLCILGVIVIILILVA